MSAITDRMKTLVSLKTTELKKYKEMEELTGITAASWRSWWNRGGPPSGEMIEAVSTIWPEYAFWLATGIPDFERGHNAPNVSKEFRERTAARDLFLAKIEKVRWSNQNPISNEDVQRWLQAQDGKGSIEAELADRIWHWNHLVVKVDQLTEIRDAQEQTLAKFELDEANKELPF